MKPIETRYAGCRFRSRLEARWAVFFDTLGIRWDYEPEGFLVGDQERPYLPDFRITSATDTSVWVEVKGAEDRLDADRLAAATASTGDPFGDRLLILGPIPRIEPGSTPTHWMIRRIEGRPFLAEGYFTPGGNIMQWGYEYTFAPEAIGDLVQGRTSEDLRLNPLVESAYIAARSARFEHGESGAPRPKPDARPNAQPDAQIDRWTAFLREHWMKIVGDELGTHTEPTEIVDGELVITADSASWRFQTHLLTRQLLERMPVVLGPNCGITSIKAVVRR